MTRLQEVLPFTEEDFAVWDLPGFGERMTALRARLSPKLEALGEAIRPHLEASLNLPFHVHVARHQRRRVHPPEDTWVALSENPRGYKMLPHFEAGLSRDRFFLRMGVLYEAGDQTSFKDALVRALPTLPGGYRVVLDHTRPKAALDPAGIPAGSPLPRGKDLLLERSYPRRMVVGRDLLPGLLSDGGPLIGVYQAWREAAFPV